MQQAGQWIAEGAGNRGVNLFSRLVFYDVRHTLLAGDMLVSCKSAQLML